MLKRDRTGTSRDIPTLCIVIAATLVHLALSGPLFDWLIDDAGISFAYARSLGDGHGLTCQPGALPVEGFSNFLWVVLLAPFFTLNLFSPYVTSKIISLLLVVLTYWTICKIIHTMTNKEAPWLCGVILLLPVTTPFLVWTTSGLENPLYAFLISLLTLRLILYVTLEPPGLRKALTIGLLAGAVALTRPDGVVYAVALLPVAVAGLWQAAPVRILDRLKPGLACLAGWISVYGGFLLFRKLYFGVWHPNTYYAKGGPGLAQVRDLITLQQHYLTKMQDFLIALTGKWLWIAVPLLLIVWLARSARKGRKLAGVSSLLLMLGLAFAAYLLLPRDWMSEYRFATPIFPLLCASLALAAYSVWNWLPSRRWLRLSVAVVGVVITLATVEYAQYDRLTKNLSDPPRVPFDNIHYNFGNTFDRYAEHLGMTEASFLVPDLGATLYYSKLRIYDLAGLCDPVIPRTRGKNQQAFYDYIFGDIKPTFIHTHGAYTISSKFDEDPRFEQDYVAIKEYEDAHAGKHLGRTIMSGNFVRRDAVEGKEDLLEDLRDGTVQYGW